jgi:putative glycosyltransferase
MIMKISIVSTLYYSERYVREFYNRTSATAESLKQEIEFVFVDDGSPDQSANVVQELLAGDARVKLICLSRNFGHHKAIVTGIEHASGDYIFVIDCDLEEPPELLADFYQAMKGNPQVDLFIGRQSERRGGFLDKYIAGMYYGLFNFWSGHSIPLNQVIARMMTRRYANDLLKFKESNFILAGTCALVGYKQHTLETKKGDKGSSTYDMRRKLGLMIDSITSFSARPLELVFYLGLAVSSLSFLIVCWLLYKKLVLGINLEGWVSIVASIWSVGGLLLFSIGIVGIYVARIYTQVKNRPFTIVKSIHSQEKTEEKTEERINEASLEEAGQTIQSGRL